MNTWLITFLSVTIVSLVSLIGVFFLAIKKEKLQKIQLILVGFATGGLLGGAFFHLLPETYESFSEIHVASVWLISGFLLFFMLERFLHWHHNHTSGISDNHIKPLGPINIIADFLHNILDGLLIGAAYVYSPQIGLATTITVLMHELPQEIGDFGVLIHSGYSIKKALLFNFISACSAFIGAALVLFFGDTAGDLTVWILPFAAGGFIYLASADLIPELHTEKKILRSIYQFTALLTGVILMFILSLHVHEH
ncbi:MAG: ZIP family metal transporter [Bacteroidales bacterium]|nr:ZIP family metal transporter [Bacteroidales bacterium]